jgi:hypothetical protein
MDDGDTSAPTPTHIYNFYIFPIAGSADPTFPLTRSRLRGIVSDMDWPLTLTIIAIVLILIGLAVEVWAIRMFLPYLPRATSATLTLIGGSMPATILIGGTANSLFQEWTGPNGTGTVIPNAGAIAYTSSNPAVATVDPASGIATGVTAGNATISGTDPVNSLTASDTLTVTAPAAQSATLTLTAN